MNKVFVFLICSLFFVSHGEAMQDNSELVVSGVEHDANIGDFFQYEVVGNSVPDSMGKNMDEEKYLRVENYDGNGLRMEVTQKSQGWFGGETVDYSVLTTSWKTKFTLFFNDLHDDDGLEDSVSVSLNMRTESWILDENGLGILNAKYIKEITYDQMHMNMTFNDDNEGNESIVRIVSITGTETQTVNNSGAYPTDYKVGSMWTTSETTEEIGMLSEFMCMDGEEDCKWETSEIDEEETSTSTLEVLREVSVTTTAGTFETLEFKDIDEEDEGGNYTLTYISEVGIPVKFSEYEEGEMDMEMQLESYSVRALTPLDEESVLGDLPSISLILSIVSIGLITIFRRSRI